MGEQTAVEDCIKSYGGLVWSLAKRMLWNTDDAEDAVQEIFLEIWKNAGKFDPSLASETTYIAMIARRRLIDRVRAVKRRPLPESLDELTVEPSVRNDKTLETSIEAREAARAIDLLKPEQQRVLRLSIVEGMSHQEIAEATGLALGTVKTHCRRGLIKVRELMYSKTAAAGPEATL